MDAVFTQWPQGATVYRCPLSGCKWSHTEPRPTSHAGDGATIEESVTNALRAHFAALEAIVRAHLETHPLAEWAQEVRMLRDQISSSAPVAEVDALPGWEPMKGVTPGGRIVNLTAGQARTVRFVGEWARNRHPVPVVLPNMGRAGGKSVTLATIARYDALGWPDDLPGASE